ncbi:tyrosine-type recombinase/integrase [uncultured Paludibaculum sp.]|uniref:site-specific integrase n=1 Tax=uncultured Paludibaculum sp. TaxID=1765020 RepID=UPI002AAB2182|nr:tyrosine-type recombinase/integrase [uncultured Paludibaculum sp.]
MRKQRTRRYQGGSLVKANGNWVGKWYYAPGKSTSKVLGRVSEMTVSDARRALAEIVRPLNQSAVYSRQYVNFQRFVEDVYLPTKQESGDWRRQTAKTAEYEIRNYILPDLGTIPMGELEPAHLRRLLKTRAEAGLTQHPLKHIKGQLAEICRMAVAEGYLRGNVAEGLKVPKGLVQQAPPPAVISLEQYFQAWQLLTERERLPFDLVLFAGMRESEVFGLWCGDVGERGILVQRSWYKGNYGPPKNNKPRLVGPPPELLARLKTWIAQLPAQEPEAPVFPSLSLVTPLAGENFMKYYVRPKLKKAGLVVNFAMLRRAHSSEHQRIGSDHKVIADQQGHGMKVHLDAYVQTDVGAKSVEAEKLYAEFREVQRKQG